MKLHLNANTHTQTICMHVCIRKEDKANLRSHPECSTLARFHIIQLSGLHNITVEVLGTNLKHHFLKNHAKKICRYKKKGLYKSTTFARPKSASFTDPLASTNIFAHLISLEDGCRKYQTSESKLNRYDCKKKYQPSTT